VGLVRSCVDALCTSKHQGVGGWAHMATDVIFNREVNVCWLTLAPAGPAHLQPDGPGWLGCRGDSCNYHSKLHSKLNECVCCLLQDLLIFSLKGLGGWAHLATQNGVEVPQEIQSFITGATFSTLTNGEQQGTAAARCLRHSRRQHCMGHRRVPCLRES
jgi:hypothetical protein